MPPRDHAPHLDGSQLAAVLVETVLYGVFIILLIQCLEALYDRAKLRQERIMKPMTITALLLLTTITTHWIIQMATAFMAFIHPRNAEYCVTPGVLTPAETVWLKLADPKSVINSGLYVTTTLVGDAFMIYRLYIVWSRNRLIIIPPILLCIALAVTGGMVTYLFSQATGPIFQSAGAWITASFVLTFLCNLYSTTLIATRIWLSNRHFMDTELYGVTKIMEILVESAVLYSCCVILSLGLYVSNSNAQFVTVAANGPIVGIIFCMIAARTHRSTVHSTRPGSFNSTRRSRVRASHALRPMTVKITTEIEDHEERSIVTQKSFNLGTPPASPLYPPQLTAPPSPSAV